MSLFEGYAAARRYPKRAAGFALFAVLLGVAALFAARQDTEANLVPTLFELDGNTHVAGATPHDWAQVFAGAGHGADKALFIPDVYPNAPEQADASDDDQPATGATKDVYDISQWDCKAAGLSPPKNDIADAFVASYTVNLGAGASPPGNHQIIYFGLDRVNSDNGDANVGFWFLKDNHDCDLTTGDWVGGQHVVGDVLVTSAFSGGGRVSTIKVYEWCSNPAAPNLKCGSSTHEVGAPGFKTDGPLQLLVSSGDCIDDAGVPIDLTVSEVCATVNRTINTDSPEWPYDGAGTPSNTYERGALFEGGIDATGLGLDLVCAGTFVADTRSSTSPTAQLHDFAIGQVDLCSVSMQTQSSSTGTTVVPGTPVSDTATLTQTPSNAPVPTGTVKFFLCQPNQVTAAGCPAGSGTQIGTPPAGEAVNASGVAASESTSNTMAIGKYCWRAEYSGDTIYGTVSHTNALTSAAGGQTPECFTTVKQPSTTVTSASPSGESVVPGTSVTDTATVSGGVGQPTPTGTVKFFLCQPNEVTGAGCPAGTGTQIGTPAEGESLNASGVATSEASTNTAAIGKYCWRAEYSGDGFYLPSSHTNALTAAAGGVTPECFATLKQPSTTVTSASPSGTSVVPGTSVSDTATVSGGVGQPTPTGTVKFFLCQPNQVTAAGCPAGTGTQIGTPVEGETLNASGVAASESTSNTMAIGKYCWRAEYSGDSFYLPSSHTNALTAAAGGVTPECFTTVKQPSTTVTSANPAGARLPGTSVSDTATVSGGVGQPTPTGTVKFFLCQPAQVTAAGCPDGVGAQIGTPAEGETLVGGVATSESTANTTALGKYCWRAEYSGDSFYLPSSHTNALTAAAGGVTPECFTIFNPGTVISIADRIVNLPSDATGSVTYGIYTDAACTTAVTTGTPSNGNITPSPNTVVGGVAPISNLYTPAAAGTFYIKAVFIGATGSVYEGVVFTSCTESAALTF